MRTVKAIIISWAPPVAWMLFVFQSSSISGKDLLTINIPNIDKVFHIVEYLILGYLLIRAFDHSAALAIDKSGFKVSLAKMAVLAIIIALCYGASDEWHQRFVPGRSCDLFDFLADCIGAAAGISLYLWDRKGKVCLR